MAINPNNIQTGYQKFNYPNRNLKFYMSTFKASRSTKISRRAFRTATDAQQYGVRVVARWKRLYNAMPSAEPVVVT